MDDRYELFIRFSMAQAYDELSCARLAFQTNACPTCQVHGGTDSLHCAVYDRLTDNIIRMVRIHSGNDFVFAAYATPCEACGTEFFDITLDDTLCIGCKARMAA
jgi:hypothetical protein